MKSENRQLLLTPAGAGAIAVIRLIGPRVSDFLREHFSRPVPPVSPPTESVAGDSASEGTGGSVCVRDGNQPVQPGRCVHGDLRDGETVIDDVVVVLGDGVADISAHGGPWVVHCVADLARQAGFEPSDELLDGTDGDTIIEKEIAVALPLARTALGIGALLAQREAWSRITPADLPRMLADQSLMHLLHPPRVAIIGVPNVGKSTLANQLFAQERSITADLPGTTRDWVSELANIDGLPVMLVDTPGLRRSDDPIEQQAIQCSKPVIAVADLVVLVLDPTQDRAAQDELAVEYPAALRVLNKTDCPAPWQWDDAPVNCACSEFAIQRVRPDVPHEDTLKRELRTKTNSQGGLPPGNATTEPVRAVATTGAGVDELRRAIQRHFHCEACDPLLPRCWTDRQRAEIRWRIARS
ncbi:MAG: GTPase [Tepidisphaeraceae bacterium]|jgi:small GTP-binding protein